MGWVIRRVGRNATINLAIEVLDDLWSTKIPPLRGGRDFGPIFQLKRIRKGIRSNFGLIEVRCVWRLGVAVRTPAKRFNMQQIKKTLVILFRS